MVVQLNLSGTDLSRASITRWIAWIQLFDFEVWHIHSRKHSAADGLSWRPPTVADLAEIKAEANIDNFILAELNTLQVLPIFPNKSTPIIADDYSDYSQKIATYLTILCRLAKINSKEFNIFKKKALKFKVQDNLLFRRNSKNVSMRYVVDDPVKRQTILQQLYNKSGHKQREGIYRQIVDWY